MSAVSEAPAGLGLPVAAPVSPYRGIEPFRVVDRAIFFGREPEVQRLFRMVTIYRGVLLYGDSGSGKSSLINAGFIPLAVQEGLAPERLRVQPKSGEEVVLERIPVGPGEGAPYIHSLVAPDEEAPRVVLSAEELLVRLKRLAEPAPAGDTPGAAPIPRSRPLLIFDQFEEFVTLFEEAPPEEARPARESLLELLAELLRSETLPVKLLFVFREDYLAKLNILFRRAPDLPDHFLRIAPLPPSALHDIVRGPFEKVTGLFERELPPSLAASLSRGLAARSEQGLLNLSEVQIACLQLWEAKDPEALFEAVKVEGLLSRYLENALDSLLAELRDPAVLVLTRLVTGAGTRNVVSKDDLAQNLGPGDPPQELLARAVDALEKTALVRREPRHDVYFYEIASEFLVPWIYRKRNERKAHAEKQALKEAEVRKRRLAYRVAVGFAALVAIAAVVYSSTLSVQARAQQFVRKANADLEKALAIQGETNARLATANATLANSDSVRGVLATRAQAAEQARDSLSRLASQQKARIMDLDARLDSVTNELRTYRMFLSQMTGNLGRADQRIERLSADTARLRRELNASRAAASQLEADTVRLRRELSTPNRLHADTARLRRERNLWRDSTRALERHILLRTRPLPTRLPN